MSRARSQSNLVVKKLTGFNEVVTPFTETIIPMFWLEYVRPTPRTRILFLNRAIPGSNRSTVVHNRLGLLPSQRSTHLPTFLHGVSTSRRCDSHLVLHQTQTKTTIAQEQSSRLREGDVHQ